MGCAQNAGDRVARHYFFYMMFLPAGARWSVDSFWAFAGCRYHDLLHHAKVSCRILSYTMMMELSLFYYMSGFQKGGPHWVEDYDAAWFATQSHFGNEPYSNFLRPFPRLLAFLTLCTLYVERYAWLLLFIPISNVRLAAVALFVAMHLGFHIFTSVGLFQFWMLGFVLAMLPPPGCDFIEHQVSRRMLVTTLFSDSTAEATEPTTSTSTTGVVEPTRLYIAGFAVGCKQVWSCIRTVMLIVCSVLVWTLYWAHAGESCGELAPSKHWIFGPCIQRVPVPTFLSNWLADFEIHPFRGDMFAEGRVPIKVRWNYIVGYTPEGSRVSLWNGHFLFDGTPFTYNLSSAMATRIPYDYWRVRKFFGGTKGKTTCAHIHMFLCGSVISAGRNRLLGFEIIDAYTPVEKPSGRARSPLASLKTRCRTTCDGSSSASSKMKSPLANVLLDASPPAANMTSPIAKGRGAAARHRAQQRHATVSDSLLRRRRRRRRQTAIMGSARN